MPGDLHRAYRQRRCLRRLVAFAAARTDRSYTSVRSRFVAGIAPSLDGRSRRIVPALVLGPDQLQRLGANDRPERRFSVSRSPAVWLTGGSLGARLVPPVCIRRDRGLHGPGRGLDRDLLFGVQLERAPVVRWCSCAGFRWTTARPSPPSAAATPRLPAACWRSRIASSTVGACCGRRSTSARARSSAADRPCRRRSTPGASCFATHDPDAGRAAQRTNGQKRPATRPRGSSGPPPPGPATPGARRPGR